MLLESRKHHVLQISSNKDSAAFKRSSLLIRGIDRIHRAHVRHFIAKGTGLDRKIEQHIVDIRIVSQSLVHRDRPRRGRPDHRMGADQFRNRRFRDLKRHIDLRRDNILVLNLSLGQRGLLDGRPHHRLGPAIEVAAGGEFQQLLDNRRFAFGLHGQVRVVPIGHHAQPLQLAALCIDPVLGIGAAFGPEFEQRHLILVELLLAVLLLNLPLDRQAVAVPPRHIRRVLAQQVLRAADHVLDRVVQRVANVHVAVRIGRAIMVHEGFAAPAQIAQLFVQLLSLPPRGNNRLLLGEAGLHREISLRQEDGVFEIALLCHIARALAGAAAFRNFWFTRRHEGTKVPFMTAKPLQMMKGAFGPRLDAHDDLRSARPSSCLRVFV